MFREIYTQETPLPQLQCAGIDIYDTTGCDMSWYINIIKNLF